MKKLTAVEYADKRIKEFFETMGNDVQKLKSYNDIHNKEFVKIVYKQAVWVDVNLEGGCVLDPYFNFHFYKEEDAVAYKLKWDE